MITVPTVHPLAQSYAIDKNNTHTAFKGCEVKSHPERKSVSELCQIMMNIGYQVQFSPN